MPYDYTTKPFRLRVQIAICEALKTITPANGYQSDFSDFEDDAGRVQERVFRGRDLYGDNDPIPMISVIEDPRPLEQLEDIGVRAGDYRLLVQGFVDDDKDHPTDAGHYVAAEIVKRLTEEKRDTFNILGFGGKQPCVLKMTFGSPVVRPPDNVISDVAFCFIPLTLKLAENIEQPFA